VVGVRMVGTRRRRRSIADFIVFIFLNHKGTKITKDAQRRFLNHEGTKENEGHEG
jgi:hypothetical protein